MKNERAILDKIAKLEKLLEMVHEEATDVDAVSTFTQRINNQIEALNWALS